MYVQKRSPAREGVATRARLGGSSKRLCPQVFAESGQALELEPTRARFTLQASLRVGVRLGEETPKGSHPRASPHARSDHGPELRRGDPGGGGGPKGPAGVKGPGVNDGQAQLACRLASCPLTRKSSARSAVVSRERRARSSSADCAWSAACCAHHMSTATTSVSTAGRRTLGGTLSGRRLGRGTAKA